MSFNLDGKVFGSISNTGNGEVGEDTFFHYHQNGNVVWAKYEGGAIIRGHLIAKMMDGGKLDMRYHHINRDNELMVGTCISTPELQSDGRLKFKEPLIKSFKILWVFK